MITQEAARKIFNSAFDHVNSFVRTKSIRPGRITSIGQKKLTSGIQVDITTRDFADFVVLHELNDEWGVHDFPKRDEAELLPLFQLLPTPSNNLQGFPSWLYMVAHVSAKRIPVGCPMYAAVFNEDYVVRESTKNNQNPSIVLNRLMLHELGHFVLHRNKLFGDLHKPLTKTTRPAEKSSPAEEEEAWLYAAIVAGLSLGDHAHDCRMVHGKPDDTWLLT